MTIKEKYICGKRKQQEKCEDGYIIKDNYIAVIDGVTSKGKHLWNGNMTSGAYAKDRIIEYLQGNIENMEAHELLQNLSDTLKKAYELTFNENIITEKLRACIIIYNKTKNEIWSYGDCQCMINGIVYQDEKVIDRLLSQKRADILKEKLKEGLSTEYLLQNDLGREAIISCLQSQLEHENKLSEFGYPVLNGDTIIPQYIKKYSVSPNSEIVLASDGYPILCKTLAESEKELHRLLEADPLCIYENISTKGINPEYNSFDDRCYIRFTI